MNGHDVLVQAAGLAGSGLSVAMWAPQAARVWRLRHNPHALAGLSVLTQGLVVLAGIVWAIYAVAIGEFWVGVPGVATMPVAIATACWVHRAHRTLARQMAATGPLGRTHAQPHHRDRQAFDTDITARQAGRMALAGPQPCPTHTSPGTAPHLAGRRNHRS